MYIIDDPQLALLVRFLGVDAEGVAEDAEFVNRQIATIQAHIAQFPEEERTERAQEWIAVHAKRYRQHWQRLAVAETLARGRCPDCPLRDWSGNEHCEIHVHWLTLLRQYSTHAISSPEYIRRSLALIAAHKERLRLQVREKNRSS